MFQENKSRGGFAKMLLISVASSLAVSLLVFFTASRYITLDRPPAEENQTNRVQQMSVTGSQPAVTGELMQSQAQQGLTQLQAGDPAGIMPVAQAVAKKATIGVVGITVERVQQREIFDQNDGTEVGVGSGVIVSSDGYILTNNHVAGGKSKRIVVSFADGRNVDGEVVWADPVLDLAAVKVNLTGLP